MQANFKLTLEELTPDFLEQLKVLFSGNANTGVQIVVNPQLTPDATSTLEVMNEDLFWELIATLDWGQEDVEEVSTAIIDVLSKKSLADIYQFEEILADKLYQLDGQKYAENIGEHAYQDGEYFSSDHFLYARCWVVACGKTFYQSVLSNPSQMPKDSTFEPLLYIAEKAYELKTAKTDYAYFPQKSYETYSNKEAWGREKEKETVVL
ncbi:MAG: DUF4240 domain-containing protein [Chitinophagales bacterium]